MLIKMKNTNLKQYIVLLCLGILLNACGNSNETKKDVPAVKVDPMTDKGIGPVNQVTLSPVDPGMVAEGQKIYKEKCTSCHNPVKKLLGPPHQGIMSRRTPEWIMNMMLNPQQMLEKDPIAIQLLKEYNDVPMTNQDLKQEEARKILEYFRTL